MGLEVPLVALLKLMWFLVDYGVIRFMSQECQSAANIKVARTHSELLWELFSLTVESRTNGCQIRVQLHSWQCPTRQFG